MNIEPHKAAISHPQAAMARPGLARCGCRRGALSTMLFGAFALCSMLPSLASAQHNVPLSTTDLVEQADTIAIASLVSAQPRWNALHNFIVTDYRFRIENTLLDGGLGNYEFVVTQGGGTIGETTDDMSGNPHLQTGERYMVFLRPDRVEMFSPFVGSGQGIYRIDRGDTATALSGSDQQPLDELLSSVRQRVQARGAQPAKIPSPSPHDGIVYPSKTYEPGPVRAMPATPPPHGLPPFESSPMQGPDSREALADPVSDPPGTQGIDGPAPNWHVINHSNRPILWDEWPHDWWCSPHDQYMMSYWNRYADNLNRISGSDLTSWAWANGRFEMVGFPSNADMIAQFQEGLGATTLAVTYSRAVGGIIQEADIAVNPAYTWTLDPFVGAAPTGGTWNLDQSVLHELGHGWGLKHPWEFQNVWWDSVMNYMPKEWRLAILHEDDTDAVRSNFPGATINTDGLVSMYQTTDSTTSMNATYNPAFPASVTVYHGGSLTFGNVQVENPGLTTITNPQLEIYLTQNWRAFSNSYVLLRTASWTLNVTPSNTSALTVSATTMPATVPVGIYYPTLWLPITGDAYTDNNIAVADPTRRVTIRNNPATLAPTTAWKTWSTGRVGPLGQWDLTLPVVAGRTYELSLCPALGSGSANFDTILEIPGIISNDDYCGLASRLLYTAPSSGTRTVRVRGFDIAAQGIFTLAYRQVVSDRIFASGFDSAN